MFNAKVYKLSVISLSGIMEETFAAKKSVRVTVRNLGLSEF